MPRPNVEVVPAWSILDMQSLDPYTWIRAGFKRRLTLCNYYNGDHSDVTEEPNLAL